MVLCFDLFFLRASLLAPTCWRFWGGFGEKKAIFGPKLDGTHFWPPVLHCRVKFCEMLTTPIGIISENFNRVQKAVAKLCFLSNARVLTAAAAACCLLLAAC